MRRTSALALPIALAALATAAVAAPSPPQLTDARGDTPVPSADILNATLSTALDSQGEQLQAVLRFAGPLDDGLPYTRGLTFTVGGCRFTATQYSLRTGVPAGVAEVGCAGGASAGARGTLQASGAALTIRIRLDGKDLRRGALVRDLAAFTHPGGVVALHTPLTTAGDVASGRDWVIGTSRNG